MQFGLLEAINTALATPAQELGELLRGITAEQRRTNELLEQLVVNTAPAKPLRSAAKLQLDGDGR